MQKSMRNEIAKAWIESIENGDVDNALDDPDNMKPSKEWEMKWALKFADKILLLFKDYRNINEPIMKKCDECDYPIFIIFVGY